tara:strand:- start:630 stop:923 length:294 start_codon:yes stop_codon:yes gene_type:complete
MDFYMYKSVCPGYLYGNHVDIRHVIVPQNTGELKVIKMAIKKANNASGSSNCKAQLLQKYLMSIEAKKSFMGLTSLQFDGDSIIMPEAPEPPPVSER